jgi:hypothetical protein
MNQKNLVYSEWVVEVVMLVIDVKMCKSTIHFTKKMVP